MFCLFLICVLDYCCAFSVFFPHNPSHDWFGYHCFQWYKRCLSVTEPVKPFSYLSTPSQQTPWPKGWQDCEFAKTSMKKLAQKWSVEVAGWASSGSVMSFIAILPNSLSIIIPIKTHLHQTHCCFMERNQLRDVKKRNVLSHYVRSVQ